MVKPDKTEQVQAGGLKYASLGKQLPRVAAIFCAYRYGAAAVKSQRKCIIAAYGRPTMCDLQARKNRTGGRCSSK